MYSLFEDLKTGLQEAIDLNKKKVLQKKQHILYPL